MENNRGAREAAGDAAGTDPVHVARRPGPAESGLSTRDRVLRAVSSRRHPAPLGELSDALDLHENTVRGHLAALLAEGRVTRSRATAEGRGRPAWLWRAVRSDPTSPYATLAGVLASSIARHSENPGADAREAGRAWGREILADCPEPLRYADARRRIIQVMADHGFAPEDDGSEIGLLRCPLLAVASDQPRVVCAVHRGMIDGLLGPDHDGAAEVELLPFAAADRCVLRLPSRE